MILLENRSVLKISGNDAASFLQGLTTNDIEQASESALLYTAMLTPQGKFLFDFFVLKIPANPQFDEVNIGDLRGDLPDRPRDRKIEEGYLLDVLTSRKDALIKRLSMYKLCSDVNISEDSGKVYSSEKDGLPDPRLPQIGKRLITNTNPQTTGKFADYEEKRIKLGLPESEDFIPEDDFPLQCNFEELHGVSFSKGCYVGQEVTARTKYKSNIKYSFYKITSEAPLQKDGKTIRSVSGNHAIAHLEKSDQTNITIHGQSCLAAPIAA